MERTLNTHLDRLRMDPGGFYVVPLLDHSTIAVPVNTAHVQYPLSCRYLQISAWELAWKPHTGQTFREHRLLPIPSRGSCHLPPIGCCQFLPQVSVAYCCTDASAAAGPNPRPPPPCCLGSGEGSAGLLGPAVVLLRPPEGDSPLMNETAALQVRRLQHHGQ